jgi:hypothetical protein
MASALLNAAAHKLRFPKYDGTEDPLPWLNRCKQFFRATQTPDDEKVLLAAFYMQGVAQQWYYRLERNQGTPTWARFMEVANLHFDPPSRSNPLGELCHLRLQGSVTDYMEAFLAHLSHCATLSEPHQVAIFTAGLSEPLQTDIELQQANTLEDAMRLTHAYKHPPIRAADLGGRSTHHRNSAPPSQPGQQLHDNLDSTSCCSSNTQCAYQAACSTKNLAVPAHARGDGSSP